MALAKSVLDYTVRAQARADQRGSLSRSKASNSANAAFNDTTASQFVEKWANLSQWTAPATPGVQVSNGALYSTGTGGGASAITTPLNLGANEDFRAVVPVYLPNTTLVAGGVVIGFSTDAGGVVPATGAANAHAVQLSSQNNTVTALSVPLGAGSTGTITEAGIYLITAIADRYYYTLTVRSPSGKEWRWRALRTAFTASTFFVFNSDSRALSGMSVLPFGFRRGIATLSPRSVGEGYGPTVHWTGGPIGSGPTQASFRIAAPANYDSRIPCPVVIAFHGNGSSDWTFGDNTNDQAVAEAFLAAGFIVASASYTANVSTWGANACVDTYAALWTYLSSKYNLGPVVVYANSMGSIESWNVLARGVIPDVHAWIGTSPTMSLQANTGTFGGTINTAYGVASGTVASATTVGQTFLPCTAIGNYAVTIGSKITVGTGATQEVVEVTNTPSGGTGASVTPLQYAHAVGEAVVTTYAAQAAGHDPNIAFTATQFGGIPIWVFTATDDTTVPPAQNWDATNGLGPALAAASSDYVRTRGTGGHSAAQIATSAPAMAAFALRHVA